MCKGNILDGYIISYKLQASGSRIVEPFLQQEQRIMRAYNSFVDQSGFVYRKAAPYESVYSFWLFPQKQPNKPNQLVVIYTFHQFQQLQQTMALNTLPPATLFGTRPNFVKINLKDISNCTCDDDREDRDDRDTGTTTLEEKEDLESRGCILVAYATRKFKYFDSVGGTRKARPKKSTFPHVKWNVEQEEVQSKKSGEK